MRRRVERLLPDTCNVQRRTDTGDNLGGRTTTWTTVASGIRCLVAPVSGSESDTAERIESTSTFTVTLPASTDVRAADRIIYGSRTFEVDAVLAGSWEVARRVLAREVM